MNALAAAVLLVAAQSEPVPSDASARGGAGWPAAGNTTTETRARLGFGLIAVVGVQTGGSAGIVSGGPGLSAEAGVVFADRYSVLWRGELASTVTAIYGSNGAFVDFAFGEHFAFGLGATFTLWRPLVIYTLSDTVRPLQAFTFPLRVHFNFGSRVGGASRRAGWTLSAHAAPGISLPRCFDCSPAASAAHFAFTAGLGFGYLWW